MDLTENIQTQTFTSYYKLLINDGGYSSKDSDFAMAELMVCNNILDLGKI